MPDVPALHCSLLACASNHGLLLTVTLPHGLNLLHGEFRMASIDHTMWFHRDFRIDPWPLCHIVPNGAVQPLPVLWLHPHAGRKAGRPPCRRG
ncbi:MAG: hypothetical protein KF796_05875 [Ramlibacter sp.]|nr:hypothetical protein [Ramlibacter sp.]